MREEIPVHFKCKRCGNTHAFIVLKRQKFRCNCKQMYELIPLRFGVKACEIEGNVIKVW